MAAVPLRVLLVGDDPPYSGMLAAELPGTPVELFRANTLAAARVELDSRAFDAVLLDLGLSDSSSLAPLERLLEAGVTIPIVVLTSNGDDRLSESAMQHGAEDCLAKNDLQGATIIRTLLNARARASFRQTSRDPMLRQSEAELREAQKMEAVGRLAGGVAHDFNNVLTAIFGYSDLLIDQFEKDDPRRSDVDEIRRAADRAASLTRQLLAFSRKQVMQPRLLDLNAVITGLRNSLERLIGGGIRLEIDTDPQLFTVRADSGQVEQVLVNLAENGRDAMLEGGRLGITTRNEHVTGGLVKRPGLAPGNYAVVEVVDSGTGIPAEVRDHIFEPFYTTKELGKGTGLGLATVYGIVKQTGGGIYVESEEGQGTSFVLYLPRASE